MSSAASRTNGAAGEAAPLVVRRCLREDLPLLEWSGEYRAHRRFFAEQFERAEQGHNAMLVAERQGEIIGQIWVDFEDLHARRTAMLWALRVKAPYRKGGVGRRLLRAGEDCARQAGAATAEIGAEKHDVDVLRFYQRAGYSVVRSWTVTRVYESDSGPERYVYDQWILAKSLGEGR